MNEPKNRIPVTPDAVTVDGTGEHDREVEVLDESERCPTPNEAADLGSLPHRTAKRGGLRDLIQRAMAAITFAEAGEPATAAEFWRSAEKRRTVLLAIEGDTPAPSTVDYALSVCERLQAKLDVLLVGDDPKRRPNELEGGPMDGRSGTSELQHLVERMKRSPIPIRVTTVSGPVSEELLNYTKRHKEVEFVVIDSAVARSDPSEAKRWARLVDKLSRRIGIPLVTVRQRSSLESCS